MKRDLRGLRVLITGASSGIGRAIADQATKAGARLALTARTTHTLDEIVGQIRAGGGDAVAIPADITLDGDRHRLLDAAADHLGGLDVLINNAGVGSWCHFADCNEEILRRVMEVNFFAPAELIRQAIPLLTRGRQPAVLNLASMCGRKGMPAWSEYSASKHALVGLTEALRGELARFEIDTLLVLPGLTASGMSRRLLRNEGRAKIDFSKGMAPEKVAAGVLAALQNNRTETVLGSDARWLLRVNRFFPRLVNYLMARRVKKLYAS